MSVAGLWSFNQNRDMTKSPSHNLGNPTVQLQVTFWSLASHFSRLTHLITLDQFFPRNLFGFIHFFYFPSKKPENFTLLAFEGKIFSTWSIFIINLLQNFPSLPTLMYKSNFVGLVSQINKHPQISKIAQLISELQAKLQN